MKKKRALVVEAHYDDTAFAWAGAIVLLAVDEIVDSVVFTDSNYSEDGLIRKQEQLEMMGILGMGILHAVGEKEKFKDGHLNEISITHIIRALIEILLRAEKENNPYERIISFGPEGYTGHPDHQILAKSVYEVFKGKNNHGVKELWQVGMSPEERKLWPGDYFVPIPKNNLYNYAALDISPAFDKKLAAITAHQTQFEIPGGGGRAHIERLKQLPQHEYFKIYRRK